MDAVQVKRVFLTTIIAMATIVFFVVLYKSSLIFLSALIGIGMATIISPAVRVLSKKVTMSRFFAALLILFAILLVFALMFGLMGSLLIGQYDSLREQLPSIIDAWEKQWNSFLREYPQLASGIRDSQKSSIATSLLPMVGKVFSTLASFATGITLATVIALFTATNSKRYFQGVLLLTPKRSRETWRENLLMSGNIVRKWFFAQLLDMAAVAILTSIGLWIVGIDYWIIYGVLAGALSIVPYAGILIVVCFSGAVVLVQQPDLFFLLLLVFFITQQLEGNFILPKVMKDRVQTPAAPLIFVMILAGSWFGPLGVFVSPPLVAIGAGFFNKYK